MLAPPLAKPRRFSPGTPCAIATSMVSMKLAPNTANAALALATLVATASFGGILLPSVYARETPSWAAQAAGQDWFDLVVLVPLLIGCAVGVLRGSRSAVLLLGGALIYSLYTFVLYALAVHFNALFLVYCAALGVSFFALVGLGNRLLGENARDWYREPPPVRLTGGALIVVGLLFYGLWLSQVVPAIARGTLPVDLAEVGLPTNPVHVLDLSIALPAMLGAGVSLLRRRRLGYLLGPMMLVFSILMSLTIATLVVVMRRRGLPGDLGLVGVFAVTALFTAALLRRMLRHIAPQSPARRIDSRRALFVRKEAGAES